MGTADVFEKTLKFEMRPLEFGRRALNWAFKPLNQTEIAEDLALSVEVEEKALMSMEQPLKLGTEALNYTPKPLNRSDSTTKTKSRLHQTKLVTDCNFSRYPE